MIAAYYCMDIQFSAKECTGVKAKSWGASPIPATYARHL